MDCHVWDVGLFLIVIIIIIIMPGKLLATYHEIRLRQSLVAVLRLSLTRPENTAIPRLGGKGGTNCARGSYLTKGWVAIVLKSKYRREVR